MSKVLNNKRQTTNNVRGNNAEKPSGSVAPNFKLQTPNFKLDMSPMLATLVDTPPSEPGWQYEVKWDGYRALAYIQKGSVELRSRNNKSFNEKFYPLYDEFLGWDMEAILDGEIVVLNSKGLPDFSLLQGWRSEADGPLVFYAFDLLSYNGKDLRNEPLEKRRALLQSVVKTNGSVRLSETFESSGADFFDLAAKMGLEGIIAKKKDSKYVPGARSKEWLKIKTAQYQEAVIGGYTINENTPKSFSALLLGLYEGGQFNFICPVGTGFSTKLQQEIVNLLKPLETSKCPFSVVPDYNKPSRFRPNPPKAEVVWVKPKIVCEISYRELTRDGAIRHPSFKGLRPDKNAKEVQREIPQHTQEVIPADKKKMSQKIAAAPAGSERKTFLNPAEETQTRNIGGHDLKFANLSKVYWPATKELKKDITKRDMLNYYYQVAPFIVPYLKDRPQTLNRYPNGINGMAFYQKDVKGKVPSWLKRFPYHSYTDGRDKEFIVCDNEASLLYIASLGCIEMNPWSSRTTAPDNPDWCIIDLDPDKNTFHQVIEAARVTKSILDDLDIPSYPKTSGSTGLHIYIPFGAQYTYEDSKEFARSIAKLVHAEIPSFTSIERKTADRGGKMYIDFLQNRPQATVAGPYSLRPKPGAPVSMPLHWEEVKKGLTIQQFNITNAVARLREQGDIFGGVLGQGIDLPKVLKRIEGLGK